jgi:hypothetical protein
LTSIVPVQVAAPPSCANAGGTQSASDMSANGKILRRVGRIILYQHRPSVAKA